MDAFPAEEYVKCAEANLVAQCTTVWVALGELEERLDKLFKALQLLSEPERGEKTMVYADAFRKMLAREKLFMARNIIVEIRGTCKEQPA